jgi:hypothetical protein
LAAEEKVRAEEVAAFSIVKKKIGEGSLVGEGGIQWMANSDEGDLRPKTNPLYMALDMAY